MKKLLPCLIILAWIFVQTQAIYARGITYEFSSVLVNYAISFTVFDNEYDHGWLSGAVGDDGLLTVRYSEIEFTNEEDVVTNSESLITLKGADGEYNFLSNSFTTGGGNGYNGNGIRIQFWAFKTLDGTNVVKTGKEDDKARAVYLTFENYQNGFPTTLTISFDEPNVTGVAPLNIYPSKTIDFSKVDSVGKPYTIVSFAIADKMPDNNIDLDDMIENEEADISYNDAKQTSADVLHELDLFKGTSAGYELGSGLTRAQAAALIVRILGKEAEADNSSYTSAFIDVREDHWAKNYIMYCFENNITFGTGNNTYSPEMLISYEQFSALVLRTLEYKAAPETACEASVDSGMVSKKSAKRMSEGTFTRGDTVVLLNKALKTRVNGKNSTLANNLQKKGVINRPKALKLNVLPDLTGENSLDVISEFIANKFE